MEEEEQDLATTVLTCEGDIHDPSFPHKLQCLVYKLKRLISDEKKPFQVTKVEPWNSVRVTFNIPREAAQRLRQLAEHGDRVLRELGILSVQVEGDQVITLTLAGRYNEPTEIVLRKTPETQSAENRTNLNSVPFELPGAESVSVPKTSEGNPKNIVQFLTQQAGLTSASVGGPATSTGTSTVTVANVATTIQSILGGQGTSQLARPDVGFRSPNVVAPSSSEPIPYLAATSVGASRLPQNNPARSQAAFGPFPFASMTYAMNTKHGASHHQPLFHMQGNTCFPYTSRSQPFPTPTCHSATSSQISSATSSTLTSSDLVSSPQVAVSSITQRSSQGTTANPVFNNFVTHMSTSNLLVAVGTTTTSTTTTTTRANVALSSPLLVNLLQSDAHTNKMMPPPAPATNQLPKRKRKPRRPKDKSPDILSSIRGNSPTATGIYSGLSSPPMHPSAPSSTCLHSVPNVSSGFDPLGVLSSQTFNVSLPNIPNIPLSPPMTQVPNIHPQAQGQPQVHTGNLPLRTRIPFGTPTVARLSSSLRSLGVMTPPISTSPISVTSVVSTVSKNESSLNRELEKPHISSTPESNPFPSPPPSSDGKIKHLINPFTGQMEPMPSDEEEEESIGSLPPFPDFEADTPENGQSERSLSDNGKDNPSDTDSGISKSHTDVSQSSAEWGSTELNKDNESKSETIVKSTNEDVRQDSSSSLHAGMMIGSSCEKLRLRLKLDPKALRESKENENREKKSRLDAGGLCQSGHRTDMAIVNISNTKKNNMSGSPSSSSEPRVPPLHISLRGPNAAVVVSPRKEANVKEIYDPYCDSAKIALPSQKKSRSPRSSRVSIGEIAACVASSHSPKSSDNSSPRSSRVSIGEIAACVASSHSPKSSDNSSRRSPRSDNVRNSSREKDDGIEEFWNKNVKTLSGGGIVQMPGDESVSPISGCETIFRGTVNVATKEKTCNEINALPISTQHMTVVHVSDNVTTTPTVTTVALPIATLPEQSKVSFSTSASDVSDTTVTSERRLTDRTNVPVSSVTCDMVTLESNSNYNRDVRNHPNCTLVSKVLAAITSPGLKMQLQTDRTSCATYNRFQNSELQQSIKSVIDFSVLKHQKMTKLVTELPDSTTQEKSSNSHLPQEPTMDSSKLFSCVQDNNLSSPNNCNKDPSDRNSPHKENKLFLNQKTEKLVVDNLPSQLNKDSITAVSSADEEKVQSSKLQTLLRCALTEERWTEETRVDPACVSGETSVISSSSSRVDSTDMSVEQTKVITIPSQKRTDPSPVARTEENHSKSETSDLWNRHMEIWTKKENSASIDNCSEPLHNTHTPPPPTSSSNSLSLPVNKTFDFKSEDILNNTDVDREKKPIQTQDEKVSEESFEKSENNIHANHTEENSVNKIEIVSNHNEKFSKTCQLNFSNLDHNREITDGISLETEREHPAESICLIDIRKKSSSPVAKIISVDSLPIQSVPKVIEVPSLHISQAVPKSAARLGISGEVSSLPSLIPSHGDEFPRSIVTVHSNSNDECYISESTLEESSTGIVHTTLLPITTYSQGLTGNRITHISKSETVRINHLHSKTDDSIHDSLMKISINDKKSEMNEKQSEGSSEESSLDSVEELHEMEKDDSGSSHTDLNQPNKNLSYDKTYSQRSLLKDNVTPKQTGEMDKVQNECNPPGQCLFACDDNLKDEKNDQLETRTTENEAENTELLNAKQNVSDSPHSTETIAEEKDNEEKSEDISKKKNEDELLENMDTSDISEKILESSPTNDVVDMINEMAFGDSQQNTTDSSSVVSDLNISCDQSNQISSSTNLLSESSDVSDVPLLFTERNQDSGISIPDDKREVSNIQSSLELAENKTIDITNHDNFVLSRAEPCTNSLTTVTPSMLNISGATSGVTSLLSSSKCVSISSDNLANSKLTLIFKGNINSSGSISQNPSSPSVVLPLSSSKTVPIKLVTLPGGHSGLSVRSTSNPAVVEIIGSSPGSTHTSALSNTSSSSSPVRLVVSKVSPVKATVPTLVAPSGSSSMRNMATVVVKSVVVTGTSSSIKIVSAKGAICTTTTATSTVSTVSTTGSLVLVPSPSVSTQLSTNLSVSESIKPITSVSVQSSDSPSTFPISLLNSSEQLEEKENKLENSLLDTDVSLNVNSSTKLQNSEEIPTDALACSPENRLEKNVLSTVDSVSVDSGTCLSDAISLSEDISKNILKCDSPNSSPVSQSDDCKSNCEKELTTDTDASEIVHRKTESEECTTSEQLNVPPALESTDNMELTVFEPSKIVQIPNKNKESDSNSVDLHDNIDDGDSNTVASHDNENNDSDIVILPEKANEKSEVIDSDELVPKNEENTQMPDSSCLETQNSAEVNEITTTEIVEETIRPYLQSNEEQETEEAVNLSSVEDLYDKEIVKEELQTETCTSLVYSKPTKRKCSENAAELIKACMGLEDNPKRTCGAKQKSSEDHQSEENIESDDEKSDTEQNFLKNSRLKREEINRKSCSQRSSSEDEMTLSELASKSRAKIRPNGEDHSIVISSRMRNSNTKDSEKDDNGNIRSGGRRSGSNDSRKSDDFKGRTCYRDGRKEGKKNIQAQEQRSPTRSGTQRTGRTKEQDTKLLSGQQTNKEDNDAASTKRKTRGAGEHQESVTGKRRRCSKDSHR